MRLRIIPFLLSIVIFFTNISPIIAVTESEASQKPKSDATTKFQSNYIIKYKDAAKGKQGLLKNQGKQAEKSFNHLSKHVSVTLSASEVEELKKDPNVEYIENDSVVKKTSDTVTNNIYQIHIPEAQAQGITGEGVKVAILDTGISRQSLELHVTGGVSFVPADVTLGDPNGHGTFLAGILAALKDDQGLLGVAPKVSLYDVKVLDAEGNGTYSQVIQGIEWAIDNDMDVVSMSFGGTEYSAALEEVMQKAYENNILLIASTGNEGSTTISYPAKFSPVVAVGAVDSNNQLASFSNAGDKVELVAPGTNIMGLSTNGNGYISMSGTSMAVPHVAGVAALIKEANPSYTNVQLREALRTGATSLGQASSFGYGLVNGAKSLNISYQEYIPPHDQNVPQPQVTVKTTNRGIAVGKDGTVSASVYDSVYKDLVSIDGSSDIPSTYDQVALNNVNLKADQAPFNIGSSGENISTLTGELSVQNTDFTLPGRNGLSFSLSRIYSSGDSQFNDMDVESKPVYHYRVYPWQFVTYDQQASSGSVNYAIASNTINQVNLGFNTPTCTYNPSTGSTSCPDVAGTGKYYYQYFGDGYYIYYSPNRYWYCNTTPENFSSCYNSSLTAIEEYRKTAGFEYYSPFFGPSYSGNYYRVWSVLAPVSPHTPTSYPVYLYSGYFNKTIDKTYQDTMFPIGKGWSWNVSSIESKRGKRYLHLAGTGTYEIDGSNKLVGYPWKDLTLTQNSSVTVNGETSYYDLKTLDNKHMYFNSEGRLIQIADAYGNTIQFGYSNVNPYGKVLTSITDAIGNAITISYTTSNVVLTMGDKTVTYSKSSLNGKEILASVQDPMGRTTRYGYGSYSAQFNFPSNTTANQPMTNSYGLLTEVTYSTGAKTIYSYTGPVTRYFGPSGYNQAYRVSQRYDKDSNYGSIYNYRTFSYSGDIGSSYSGSYEFTTTVDDGLKQTTYTNYKQYISDTVPAAYYTTKIIEKDKSSTLQKNMTMSFDTTRRLPVPNTTTVTSTNGTSTSTPITVKRSYDDFGNVLTDTDPNNVTTTYTYDGTTHLLTSVSQPISINQTRFVQYLRNTQGSITQVNVNDTNVTGALRSQTNFGYADGRGNITSITVKDDNRNIVVNQEFGSLYGNAFLTKRWVTVKGADATTSTVAEQMQYDKSTGNMTQYTDGKGYSTSYQYDKLGRVKLATFPDNSQVTLTYDDANNKVTAVDQTGLTSVVQWNPLGWKVSEGISGTNSFTTYGYDAYGRLAWSQDALSHRINYAYDAWSRLTKTTYPDSAISTVSYDDIGFTKTIKDQEENQSRESYDLLGRVTKKEWLKPTGNITIGSYTYDYAGNVITSVDGNNNATINTYDVLNRLLSVKDAQNNITTYGYNLAGKLKQIQFADGSLKTSQYDELGRLIIKTDPAGLIETYYYDANGNLTKQVDRKGQIQTFAYNNRNFLTSSVTGQEAVSYTYDTAGRRLSMVDGTGTTSYAHEPMTKQLKTVTYPDGKKLNYQYNAQGSRTQMTDPFGFTTAYGYDNRNRLTGVGASSGNWDAIYTYKKNNLVSTIMQGNAINSTFGYDGFNLTSLTETKLNGAAVNSFSYKYDNNYNQTSKTENGTANSFTYDKLNRIETSTQFIEQYSYDSRGNRLMYTGNAPNLLAASYTYDDRNRLTRVVTGDGKNVTYRYNGDGLLYERMENGVTTRYYYDGLNIIAEGTVTNGTVTLKARYERGRGLVARIDASGNKQYYLHNGHGDVVGLTDASGNILNQYTYDMWGNPITAHETIEQPFRYSGEYWDSSTGLQYLRARWYDPSIGRFINEDSYEGEINNPLSMNLYTYGWNNPLRYTDPTGHNVCGIGGAGTDWCNNYFGQVGSYAQGLWYSVTDSAVYKGTKAVADFAILDDVNTLVDGNASVTDKTLAGLGFAPVGKMIKGGKLVVQMANKYKSIERAVEATDEALNVTKVIRARPESVVNALSNFSSTTMTFGSNKFLLDKSGMTHILERHHPSYWDGSVKSSQTFFNESISIDDISSAIQSVMSQNRETLINKGATGMYQITGSYNGTEYILGLNNGRVGQFYPK
ncbi:S8 family serine peptidase [Paenibacillus sp. EPM92]|uniref:S8 family serine peptidase n=1 Tax=Paenibacillus sp. EPM92 TaxID=1561195 RepID=UPI0019166C6E|nr:S8 family serine peptidase [Paenibacillus sp. EPM92]